MGQMTNRSICKSILLAHQDQAVSQGARLDFHQVKGTPRKARGRGRNLSPLIEPSVGRLSRGTRTLRYLSFGGIWRGLSIKTWGGTWGSAEEGYLTAIIWAP